MRRVLLAVGVLLALFVVALFVLPIVLKDEVVGLVRAELNRRVDADITLGDASLSLVRAFPDLRLDVTDLVVTGREPFAGVELARVGSLGVELDLMSVLGGGPVRVTGLALAATTLDVRVNAEGRANTDLTAPADPADAEADAPATELWLRDIALTDVTFRYEDAAADTRVVVTDLDLTGDAEVADALVALRAQGGAAALSVRNAGVNLLTDARVVTDLDVRYAPETGRVQLGDSTVRVNELAVALAGTVAPEAAGTALDLTFAADKTTFKSVLSLIPGAYTPDFGGVQADGTFTLRGAVKGLLPAVGDELPGFDLAMALADGTVQYPGLPSSVRDIQLDLAVKHPGGLPDAVAVDVPRFRLAVDGSPLEGRLSLRTPMSDPALDLAVRGKLDLGRLAAAFPDSVSGWTGVMDMDIDLAGKVSAFSAGNVDAVRAAGTFQLTDATWTSPTQPLPIVIETLKLAVEPRKFDLAAFRLRFGQSDLSAEGQVENAIGWALADQVLVGRLDARARRLDLNPWAGGSDAAERGAAAAPDDESSLFVVPANLDLTATVAFDEVLYDGWNLRDVRGGLRVKDGAVELQDLRSRTLGGELVVGGTYRAPTDAAADLDLRVSARDLVAADTFARFETARRILPGLDAVVGRVRTLFYVRTRIGKDLRPDLASLASEGSFGGTGLALDAAFLKPVAQFLGDSRLGSLALDGGDVGFRIEGGQLRVDKMPVALGPAKGALQGTTGVLDEGLDLTLDLGVPTSAVKGAAALSQASALAGRLGDTLDVRATIGGTWKAPKVKVGLGDALQGAVEGVVAEVKDVVAEKASAALDTLVAEARAQGDRLMAEAEAQADKLRGEAKAQIDRVRDEADKQAKKLVKEAKGNPLREAAAKEGARVLREEADKQADKLDKEADKQADKLVAAARKERDRLLADAEAKAAAKIKAATK